MTRTSSVLRRGLDRALDLLLPRSCLACARRLGPGPAPLLLCLRCRGRLERVDPRLACRGCLRPLPVGATLEPLCLGCRAAPPDFERAVAVWRYRPPLDVVLRALKYRGLDFLGPALADEVRARLDPGALQELDLVAPVPLAAPRRLARGFNQAERIARPLAAGLDLAFAQPLRRRSGGGRQARSGRRQRQANASGAFAVRLPAVVAGRRILLVDDVLTTGATARAAATALRASGAASVVALAIAATPPEAASGAA